MDTQLALGRTVSVLSDKKEYSQYRSLETTFDISCFVLLGDPGSGKTHSFKAASEKEQGDYLTVREYIATNGIGTGEKPLYLDALDEYRSSFKGKDLIMDLTRLLTSEETKPPKFRLSCRAADWYGESDLQLLRRSFPDEKIAVVSLESLRRDEIDYILKHEGISNAESFIEQAEEKGVEGFLYIPQTLLMLSDVVKGGDWPNTKSELFSLASRVLLTEHNSEHLGEEYSSLTENQLEDATGYVCSVILLSGVAGVSLGNQSSFDDFISYKDLGYKFPDHVKACLIKRAFTVVDQEKKLLTYFHRTNAEYLAAKWLNVQVENGYPLSRLLTLICHEGTTFSELRGLYAWFVSLNKNSIETLIKIDPYGILEYGDVSTFTLKAKKILLQELSQLAEEDPWFRSFDKTLKPLGKLSSPGLVDDFENILTDAKFGFHIKSLILDVVSNGPKLKEIKNCLISILLDSSQPQSLRGRASVAIINVIPDGDAIVLDNYRTKLSSDILIKIDVISALEDLSEKQVTAPEFSGLLLEVLRFKKRLAIGHLFGLRDAFDIEMVVDVLNSIDEESFDDRTDWENRHEVESIYRRFVYRAIDAGKESYDPFQVFNWLKVLYVFSGHSHGRYDNENLLSLLNEKPFLLSLFAAAYDDFIINQVGSISWLISRFSRCTFNKLTYSDIANWALAKIQSEHTSLDEKFVLYEMIGITIFYDGSSLSQSLFEAYFKLAEQYTELLDLRNRQCYELIPEWRIEETKRKLKNDKKREQQELTKVSNLNSTRDSMRSGKHIYNLTHAARVYFNLQLHDGERHSNLTPVQRLDLEAGTDITKDISIGFVNVLLNNKFPSMDEVIKAERKHSFYYWWYIPLAGLSELINQGRMQDLSPAMIKPLITLHIFMLFEERPVSLEQAISLIHYSHPELVHEVVKTITLALLKREKGLPTQLSNYLLSDSNFKPWLTDFLLDLLEVKPNLEAYALSRIIKTLVKEGKQLDRLYKITNNTLTISGKVRKTQRALWLILGFFLDPDMYEIKLRNYTMARSWVVWQLKEMLNEHTKGLVPDVKLSKLIIEIAGRHFPYVSYPTGTRWGGEHPWEASHLIEQQITHLSSIPSVEAEKALGSLLNDKHLVSYKDNLKHAACMQMKLRKEQSYKQPSFSEVVQSLNNGEPSGLEELQSILIEYLVDLQKQVKFSEQDSFHLFWNTNSYGKPIEPKNEERCRDTLITLLKPNATLKNIQLMPEGHMASDKRVDIAVQHNKNLLPVEIKRHYHSDIWTAIVEQLDRFYSCHPNAKGYGIYLVLWFGADKKMPLNPNTGQAPNSAMDLKQQLEVNMPEEFKYRIKVFVLDVTKDF